MPLSTLATAFTGEDRKRVEETYHFAFEHLQSVIRRTGEDYFHHGFELAETLLECHSDASLVCVALLHDLLLHPEGEALLRESPLTKEEHELARGMNRLRRLYISSRIEDLDRFIDAFIKDGRLLLLRMAHRLNDVRHLDRFEPSLQTIMVKESFHMYTAIAGRLGIHHWRHEMEDICFRELYPDLAQQLEEQFKRHRQADELCLSQTQAFLNAALQEKGIQVEFQWRIKTLYSTYRKMVLKDRAFDELMDRLALRILVDKPEDCYRVLGVVHSQAHPIPGKLKDYIGAPKENGYQSIHTVIYPIPSVTEQSMEIQIRTEEMHDFCEFGPAAHGQYKDYMYSLTSRHTRVNLLRNFQSLHEQSRSPEELEKALRNYFDERTLSIFDSENRLYHIPRPATALDFVCHAFPKRFKRLKSLRVNGRKAPLNKPLKDGDVVDPEFSRSITLEADWSDACEQERNAKKILEQV